MSAQPPRFDVTEVDIARVVASFYAKVRVHPELGPVFAAHVTDWPKHEAKIARFWQNAILHRRVYDGNPMVVHAATGDVQPAMFEPWLSLFDSVLKGQLAPVPAAAWSELAHRIGRGLRSGLEAARAPAGSVPRLR